MKPIAFARPLGREVEMVCPALRQLTEKARVVVLRVGTDNIIKLVQYTVSGFDEQMTSR
jgi:hypothetical protein